MPALFQMPFLARLTPTAADSKKRAFDHNGGNNALHAQERDRDDKRQRLSTQILSSRPKFLPKSLLSPVKGIIASPSATVAPIAPGGAGALAKAPAATQGDAPAGRRSTSRVALIDGTADEAQKLDSTGRVLTKKEDKRSLRSHDGGSRSRSELAQYFPNWDEIISNEPQPQEPLTAKTRLHITEEPPKPPSTPSRKRQIILAPTSPTLQTPTRISAPPSPPKASLTVFTCIDFSSQLAALPKHANKDPLSEAYYKAAHQRGERQEKQLRNIEKEKAQHEKVQLERLYEGLLGPDWLRVMGISGITDTEKRSWEQKRDWVVREVKGLLDKFDRYKEEEKRMKAEKEVNMHDEEDDDNDDDDADENEEEEASDQEEGIGSSKRGEKQEIRDTDEDEEEEQEADHRKRRRRVYSKKGSRAAAAGRRRRGSTDAPAAQGSTDELVSQQLQAETQHQQEQSSSTAVPMTPRSRRQLGIDVTPLVPQLPPAEEKPFVSFFEKPHLRAAALAGHRRGRTRFAFGHSVPELDEREFALPREMVTSEARKTSARMRRLRRRSGKGE